MGKATGPPVAPVPKVPYQPVFIISQFFLVVDCRLLFTIDILWTFGSLTEPSRCLLLVCYLN